MPGRLLPRRPMSALRTFLRTEASGGILLIAAAAIALILANAGEKVSNAYFELLHATTGPVLADKLGAMTVHLWINDAAMALFFLLVGLEIKREFVDGQLARWSDRTLPMIAAAAGMIVPAAIYLFIVRDHGPLLAGWAIPAATDIAFAIGVLALLGKRAPTSLKLFLTTVAIVDDMGAVAIIAIAYTKDLAMGALVSAALALIVLATLSRMHVIRLWPYLLVGLWLWLAVLQSGIHATIAGVLVAAAIPIRKSPGAPDGRDSPLHTLEHALHPWVAWLIVPLFALANAGVSFAGMTPHRLFAPLPLAVAAGLVLGKQIGIFGAVWLAAKAGIARRPGGATWLQVYGVALLCGIGFTMSLFIGGLAFPASEALIDEVKIGVLSGSLIAALAGFLVLRFAPPKVKIAPPPN